MAEIIDVSIFLTPELKELWGKLEGLVSDDYKKNDPMHQMNHAKNVIDQALSYVLTDHNSYIFKEIIAAGLLHDCKIHENREEHHTKAANWVAGDEGIRSLLRHYGVDLNAVIHAIQNHRASSKSFVNWHAHPVSHYIATADRRLDMKDHMKKAKRLIRENKKEEYNEFVDFLYRKYNKREGYAVYPPFVHRHRGEELRKLHKVMESRATIASYLEK